MNPASDPQEMLERLRPQLSRLPIFPLQCAHVLPGALLPLYIFEPRYRALTAACVAGGGAMAIATLDPGFDERRSAALRAIEEDYQGRPPVRPIASAGLVVAHRHNPDGTYHLLLQGVARVRIDRELPPEHAYREVEASLLPDVYPAGFDAEDARQALLSLSDKLFAQLATRGEGIEELRAVCHAQTRAGELTDVLGATVLSASELQLQLLETADVAARLDLVIGEIARILAPEGHRASAN